MAAINSNNTNNNGNAAHNNRPAAPAHNDSHSGKVVSNAVEGAQKSAQTKGNQATDGFVASAEVSDTDKAKLSGEASKTGEGGKADKADGAKEGEDVKKDPEADKADKAEEEKKALEEQLKQLREMLEQLLKAKEQGQEHGAEEGGPHEAGGPEGGGGAHEAGGAGGAEGGGTPDEVLQKLAQKAIQGDNKAREELQKKYDEFQQQGVELQPQTKMIVEAALSGGGGILGGLLGGFGLGAQNGNNSNNAMAGAHA